MENEDMKKCPFCAEMIKADAIKCRYCGSTIVEKTAAPRSGYPRNYWRRVNEGKRVAGVCSGLAREFDAPKLILPLRLFFILTTIFYGFGFIFYIVLWLLMPAPVDGLTRPAAGIRVNSVNEYELTEAGYQKRIDPMSALLGFLLLAAGAVLMLAPMGRNRFWGFPIHFDAVFPKFIHDSIYFNINWITGLWPVLILLGLILLFFGALRFLRIALGCGLIAVGAVFLILFIPFLPGLLVFPGMLILGLILIFIGGLKLVFGSSKVVKQEVVSRKNATQDAVTDEDLEIKDE